MGGHVGTNLRVYKTLPYPSEHSARLRDPGDFDNKSFRRTKGGIIYGKIKVPSTIGIIWGKLKGKAKPSDPPVPQALRFPVKSWTAARAKKWLKDNKVKYQRFEAASGKKEKQSMDDNQSSFINNHSNAAPVNACIFNERAEVMFAGGDPADGNKFMIVGYSGGIIKDHWYWGNLAIDLEGARFAKKRIPVLADHFTSSRVGFSTNQQIKERVLVEGEFLDNDNAQSLRNDIKKGFPMEASLFCLPSVIEKVAEGASVKVNGQLLKGPGTVFRKSVIKEVSMCVFGTDSNTTSSALAGDEQVVKFNLQGDSQMSKNNGEKLTIEQFAEQYPDLHSEIFEKAKEEGLDEGKKAEQDRFASLKEACGSDGELLVECFASGLATGDALKMRAEKLESKNKELTEQMSELKKNPPKKETVDPAVTEFTDEAADPNKQTNFDEKTATEAQLKEHYEKTAALQDEFHSAEAYLAYVKREVKAA